MSDYNKNYDETSFADDPEMQHYIMKPEGEPSDDTFDVMTTIAAFLRYHELRLRNIVLLCAMFAGLSIIVCTVGVSLVRHLYANNEISYTVCRVLTMIVMVLGVFFTGFSLERRASIQNLCDEMLQIVGSEGVVVTKKMEDEYRERTSSIIKVGSLSFRIHWDENYFKACGLDEEVRQVE